MLVLKNFYNELWQQYIKISPQALAIHHLFESEGESLVNDHVAFRTFSNSNISIDHLEQQVFSLGYHYLESYHFDAKKLDARCYVHPNFPTKIFISELRWRELSTSAQTIINALISQIEVSTYTNPSPAVNANTLKRLHLNVGRIWEMPTYKDYLSLLKESEYAAWLSVWGLRANHFTLFVNHLKKYPELSQVVGLLQDHGYDLNSAGGLIKGSKSELLIQSSTMADQVCVLFPDADKQKVSTCYYEFAQRFKQKDGLLYQGFVPNSADKIFESTNCGVAND
ncbi:MAG: hypothetical protein ACJAWS_000297 [Oleiphilaceae bacterium]|jgi:hypothetical protein